MLNTSFNPNEFMTLRVDSKKVAIAECEHLREAIALSVIKRTAKKYPEVDIEMLRVEAANFASTKHIVMMSVGDDDGRRRFDRRYDFTSYDYEGNAETLERLLKDLNDLQAYYCDRISFEHDNSHFSGFCWNTPGGRGKMIGYFIEPESQPGDWDYDEIAEADKTDNTTSDTTASTYRTDLAQIINAGAVWNAAHAAYERGIAFDIDAINQMVLDITLLKRDTKSWKVKDMCNQLLARLSEYGFQ